MRNKHIKIFSLVLSVSMISSIIYLMVCAAFYIPNDIVLLENSRINQSSVTPYLFKLELNTEALNQNVQVEKSAAHLSNGSYKGTVKFLGAIPVKSVSVNVIKQTKLIPCGNSIGVKLFTDGIVVVDIAEFESSEGKMISPCKNANIESGDVIVSANGMPVRKISDLAQISSDCGGKIKLKIRRDKQTISQTIELKTAKADGLYKLGLMVRDSAAGIGTLTFYNPDTKHFGALGHGISDTDTGKLLPVASGEILPSSIISVEKGVSGRPGELRGSFVGDKKIGTITSNCDCGLFGSINPNILNNSSIAMEIASKSDVKTGDAYILSNVTGDKVEKFNISIIKVSHQTNSDTKSMVIKITDTRLLEKTGGIVQGMSGSPIIQKGKLVGAVTHVFVNDPTRGYGIFIENMLSEAEKIK